MEESQPSVWEPWSRRAQIAFVGVVMPLLVLLLVGAPYALSHYIVNPHSRFNYIPPPLGGDRALEGHWTDAPVVAVVRKNFDAGWSAFGWVAADDDLTTNVAPPVTGKVSQILATVGQTIAKEAPLFAVRPRAADESEEIVVKAPSAGVVTRLDLAIGQAVTAGKTVVSIADLSSVWLVAEIDESDARSLRPDQAVEVRPTASSGHPYKGKILSVSAADPQTSRATVRILLENPEGALKLNTLAEFIPLNGDDAGTLAVPESAALFENGGARVFVVAPSANDSEAHGKLTARDIRIGRIRDGMVEVTDGLKLGENVEASDGLFIDRAAKGY